MAQTIGNGSARTLSIEPGKALALRCDSTASAVIWTYAASHGGQATGRADLGPGQELKLGPYSSVVRLVVEAVGGNVTYEESPVETSSIFTPAKLAAAPGCVQTLKLLGAAGQSVGAAYTFSSAWMVEGDYNAVRFLYANYGNATYNISAAKTAPSATLANNGTGLSFTSVTFDKAATAKAGDAWDGTTGSTTTCTVPVAISGTGANVVPSLVWSDWVAQQSVPCTEPGASDLRIINHRVYSSSTGYSVANAGTSASNWGNYNTFSRRKVYGQLTAGDQVGTINAVTLQANWQWMMCIGVQALLTKPVYNHGVFGDSISKGQGSFDNNNGLWGWAQRASQQLSDMGLGRHSVVNYACSGQGKSATWATFLNVISQGGLDTATMFPWSPNDGISAGSAPWNLNSFKFQVFAFISECRKYGVKPIVATQPPSVTITDAASDLIRVAQNLEVVALRQLGVTVADFDAAVSDKGSPARYATGMTNGDHQHPSSLGHDAMRAEEVRAIREALGI